MMSVLSRSATWLRQFRRKEDGNSTLEFVLVLPAFLLLFTSAYEAGVLSTRHVMLEHGLDVVVRQIRIGAMPEPDHDMIRDAVCDSAGIIPECHANLRLEMLVRDPFNWVAPPSQVSCVDREEEGEPVLTFQGGGNNQLMILRACSLFDPMIPTSGLGKAIPKESGGAYALVATSAFVMEPFQ